MTRASEANLQETAHTAEPLLETRSLGVFREGRWLVRKIDMTVRPGEIVTLIGPNGSGKSTTVRSALGLLRTDEGTVRRKPGLTIGYVPQKLQIDWSMPLTVERLMRLTAPLRRDEIAAALAQTGVGHLMGAGVHNLSGGEFQRVLLARAIARRPELLVLDEPVQGVDFSGEVALYELIAQFRDKTGCGVLLISHDLHVVMAATDTVICLNGHVCCSGPPEVVAESADYARLFGRRGSEALAIYRHQHDHTHLPDGRVRLSDGSVSEDHHLHGGHCDHDHDHPSAPAGGLKNA
jgi:zinc transport system ATP-binding protein